MERRPFFVLLALGVLATVLVVLRFREEGGTQRGATDRTGLAAEDPAPPAPVPPQPGTGAQVPTTTEPAPTEEPPPPSLAGMVTGVVRLEGSEPYGEVTLRLRRPGGEDTAEIRAAPHPDGTFRVDGLAPGTWRLEASHPAYFPRTVGFALEEGGGAGPLEILLKRGGALRVRVRGIGGLPLEGERIELRAGGPVKVSGMPPLHAGRTDAEGVVLFEHLAPAEYEVQRPVAGRGEDGQMRMATVVPGETVDVVFDVSCGLTGSVVGPEGEILAGAYVRLIPVDFGTEGYRQEMTKSDPEGRFRLQGVPAGEYRITVQVVSKARSFVASAGTVALAEGQVLEQVVRVLPNSVSGRILRGDTGEPFRREPGRGVLAEAQAYLVEVGADGKAGKRLGESATAYADEEGRYELLGLRPGHWWIWFPAPAPTYADASLLLDLGAGGRREGVDVKLEPRRLATLRLTVREPDGSPATGLSFSLATEFGSRTLHGAVRDGELTAQVPEGEQTVYAHRRGFHAAVTATFVAGKTLRREVTLRPAAEEDG